jgi:hypothetical protein
VNLNARSTSERDPSGTIELDGEISHREEGVTCPFVDS